MVEGRRPRPSVERFAGRSIFVTADGLRLHLLEYGDAGSRDLLLLPGITSPAPSWEFVAESLSKHFHVYTLDIRGRGLSDAAAGYSSADYAEEVAGVIEALGLHEPLILGHSMGARIAVAFAALKPEAACPMVVVDPPLTGPDSEPYSISEETFVTSIKQSLAGATADDMRPFFPSWDEEHLELRAEWLPTCDIEAVAQTHRYFHSEDFFDFWPKVAVPTVFIYGAESPAVTDEGAEEVRQRRPDIEQIRVPAAGHMIPFDNFEGFMEVVIPALEQVGAE